MKTIEQIKTRARKLQRDAEAGIPSALQRIEKARAKDERIRRRHCLAAISNELGFAGWPELVASLSKAALGAHGTYLYPSNGGAHWNIWFADYDEARNVRHEHGGFLLGYKSQFFICDESYITELGLEPSDPDWDRIGRDWIKPRDLEARDRLASQLIGALAPTRAHR